MSAELDLGTLIRARNPYTDPNLGSMWIDSFAPPKILREPTPSDLSHVTFQEDSWSSEWVFRGEPYRISKAIRVQCRWLIDASRQVWMTDNLLIGYEGETVSEVKPDRTATSGTAKKDLLSFLSDDPQLHVLGMLGFFLIIGFAWFSSTWVSSVLFRADAIDDAQFAMYSVVSNLRGYSVKLSATTDDLVEEIATLGQEIAAVGDQDTKEKLERWFSPASKSANRVHQISMDIEHSFQSDRLGGLYQKYGDKYLTTIPNLITPAFAQISRAQQPPRSSSTNVTPDLRRMYEETAQKRDKIQLFQNGFYVLAGLGSVLLITLVVVPHPTKQTLAEIAKMYVPALISSWGTFMAGISI